MRNVYLLATAQMLASSGLTVVVILGGIIGADIAPDPSWATVPMSLSVVAIALTSVPAALLMRRTGRRAGFVFGALVGVIGGLVCAQAVLRADFWLFCCGTVLLGGCTAFTLQYRFAAAESVPRERVSRAVSFVLFGSLGAAVMNPQVALIARWWIAEAQYAGSFVAVSVLYALAIVVLTRLNLPAPAAQAAGSSVSVGSILGSAHFRMAVLASASAFAVMSFIMTAAPLSMHHVDHYDVEATTWVIQSHVLAMYLPSLFTGQLVARFGERKVMIAGGVLLAACAAVSLHGHHFMHYWTGLVVLGLGWNLLFVAGTTLLAHSIEGPGRHRAQAINEFTVFGCQACASLLAGWAVQQIGWQMLNVATLPLLAVLIVTALRLPASAQERATAVAAPGRES